MNIYLTLDYELFSSKVPGTPKQCIISPMKALSEVVDKYGVKFTIFVDAAYLYKLKELKDSIQSVAEDYEMLIQNIQELVKNGHDIQLHFHPQWIYTNWNSTTGTWDIDTIHFKLSDMDPELAMSSFKASKELLDEIAGYQTTCFRACGYCLETYRDYIELLQNNGIEKDSSVVRYCHVDTPVHQYDYRIIPQEHIYRFEDSVCIKNDNGRFKELNISTFYFNALNYVVTMKGAKSAYKPGYIYKDGKALPDRKHSKFEIFWNYFKGKQVIASLDGLSSQLLPVYYQMAEKQAQDIFVVCGHPKNATESSIKNLDRFLAEHITKDSFLTSRDL